MRAVSLLTACSVMLSLSGCMTQDELLPFDGSRVTLLQLAPLIEGEDIAVISTDFGEIRMRFFPSEAPNAVNNFVTLAREGFFNDRAVIGPRGLLASSLPVLICDRDHVVAAAGVSKKEFTERRISAQLEEAMEQRQTHVAKAGDQKRLQPVESIDRYAGVMCPIVAAGDVTGAVCMLLPESGAVPTEGDVKLAQVAAAFLGKQMEE